MTSHVEALVVANALMLALGCGLLPLLRLASSPRELVTRAPLGYAVGLAGTGVLSADLAVTWVAVGRILLPVLAVLTLAAGLLRIRRGTRQTARAGVRDLPALAVLAVTIVLAVPAARLLAVKPLVEWDGWAIWGLRARALYDFGHPVAPAFTNPVYVQLQHPLLLPGLEALDFRFMGAFDGTTVHLQLLGLAIGFVGGGWSLLRATTNRVLLASTLLAIVCAPTFFNQLQTNYADIPLALFISLGVAALATWLRTGGPGLLPAAALFLAAGALTKNEGECFALTAIVAALLVARRTERRPVALTGLAVLGADLPWRIWLAANHVATSDYSLANLFDPGYLSAHAGRIWPSVRQLVDQISSVGSWSYLAALVAVGFSAASLLRHLRGSLFGAAWLLLSFGALVAIYWISRNPLGDNLFNSADRTIDTLVIGSALLVPVILAPDP